MDLGVNRHVVFMHRFSTLFASHIAYVHCTIMSQFKIRGVMLRFMHPLSIATGLCPGTH